LRILRTFFENERLIFIFPLHARCLGLQGLYPERIACIVTERVAFMLAFVKNMLRFV
jgi:hypothetical protein